MFSLRALRRSDWRLEQALARDVEALGDGSHVGTCGVAFHLGDPEISYAVLPQERGHGAATEATRLLTEWAFGQGFPQVVLRTDAGNSASESVARRAGFSPRRPRKNSREVCGSP